MKHVWLFLLCLWGILLVFVPSLTFGEEHKDKPRMPLAMEVFLKKPQPRVYELHVHLTNMSEDVMTVNVRDLPWNPPNDSKWFSVFLMDEAQSPVKLLVQDWNIGSRVIQIRPGESIQDAMVLNPRIPSLLEDVAEFGVQVRWDCPPVSLKFMCQKGAFQVVTIPRGDAGTPTLYKVDSPFCDALGHKIGLIRKPEGHEVLFLETSETMMADIRQMQALLYQVNRYVEQCEPSWTNSWAVSFFTEARFAGFLGDEGNREYFKQGVWQQVNIGQYSSQIRILFRFPWVKARADEVYLSVYQ